ncbi:Actin-related protein 6 [Ceratocystis pirilliformis]|uniref:Actin-related protein 6 n=1 Tax=Ceratocystis pirilliformis TaxID=259994 RepID=A0ABR3YWK3_9PEZI
MAPNRRSQPFRPPPPSQTLVLDNGAYTLKAGLIASSPDSDDTTHLTPRVIPNCLARDRHKKVYVGSEVLSARDYSEMTFRRPVEKGFIVNWESQKEIWDREILGHDKKTGLGVDPAETSLLLGEAPGALPALQTNCDQIVFEEYGFARYCRSQVPTWNAYNDIQAIFQTPKSANASPATPAEIVLVIDSGYSHTHVTPLINGRPLHSAQRRLDIGGRFLTNYLARQLSVRYYDMRNDTHIVNEIKERACFVSADFAADLEASWKGPQGARRPEFTAGSNGVARHYVLPDFHSRMHGEIRPFDVAAHVNPRAQALKAAQASEDIITLRNERFTPPELLFMPSDAGMHCPGIPDMVVQALEALPVGLWPGLLLNIVVVGGNALFDGLVERLQKEITLRMPDECVVRVARPADPIISSWTGGVRFARHPNYEKIAVTKQEYEENGAAWVARKFVAGLNSI